MGRGNNRWLAAKFVVRAQRALQSVLCIIVLTLGFFSPGTAQSNPPTAVDVGKAISALQEWIGLVQSFQSTLDLTEVNAGELVFSKEFDADALIDFVRNDIVFEQYPGTMRGKDGTLVTRAGNALDQAILLAALLKDAGFEARIARGTLDAERARALLEEMFHPVRPQTVFTPESGEAVEAMLELTGRPDDGSSSQQDTRLSRVMTEQAERLEKKLRSALKAEKLELGTRSLPDRIVQEAREYFWVQYRLAPGDSWIDVHPGFSSEADAIQSVQPSSFLADSVPPQNQQRIWLQVKATRRVGSQSTVVPLTARWERPVSNMLDVAVPVRIVSRAMSTGDTESTSPNEIFVVLFGDSLAPGAQAFTLGGAIVDADAAMSNMAGVFAEVSGKAARATTALMDLHTEPEEQSARPAMQIEAVWLEIGLDVPGAKQPFVARRVFASTREGKPIGRDNLVKSMHLEAQYGPEAVARKLNRAMDLHVESIELAIARHRALAADSAYERLIQSLRRDGHVDWRLLNGNTLFGYLAEYRPANPERVATYFDEPRIVIRHANLSPESEDPTGIDIVRNSRRSFLVDDGGTISLNSELTFSAGVWEALAEHQALEAEGGTPVSAAHASIRALETGEFRLIDSSAGLSAVSGLEERHRNRIGHALEQSRLVIFPATAGATDWPAWWELDLQTGKVMGVVANGWGGGLVMAANITERVIMKPHVLVTCLMAANLACHAQANAAVAALQIAVMTGPGSGAKATCEAILAVFGEGIPPGNPVCTALMQAARAGGQWVAPKLRALKKPLWKACLKRAAPECVKAATVAP